MLVHVSTVFLVRLMRQSIPLHKIRKIRCNGIFVSDEESMDATQKRDERKTHKLKLENDFRQPENGMRL